MLRASAKAVGQFVVGSVLLTSFCGAASASATLGCTAKDQYIEFDLLAAIGSLPNARFQISQSQLKLTARDGWPEATLNFVPDDLGQQWAVDPDLRLRIYHETEGGKLETDLVVIAKKASETQYRGQYRLTVKTNRKERKHIGRINCELGY